MAAWFDDTYAYRHRVTFTHNADITSDRAVTFTLDTAELISANVMQSDCDDTRFTDANGKYLLFDLTGTCNNAATTYEVIFPNIVNGSNLFYVYYGNPGAVNAEINSAGYTALTPSGGDSSETDPTTDGAQEQGPAPISYWNFDEANGSTANDFYTQQNNDLIITGAVWRTTDLCVFGNCLQYDGNADYATKTYSADTELLPGTSSFSISGWFKHTSTAPGTADTSISRIDAVNGVGWKIYMNSSGNTCFGIDDTAGAFPADSACTTTSQADSQWHYVVGVKSGTTSITLYLDGVQAAQDAVLASALTLNGTNSPMTVGNDFDNGTNGWDGFIDEVKYYNFAKTAAQVRAEFVSKSTPKGTSASFGVTDAARALNQGLVGYWKMDENSTGAAQTDRSDSSGNATALTDTNTTASAAGKFDDGADFESTNSEYLFTADNAPLSLTGSLTLSAWIRPESVAAGSYNILAKWDGSNESYRLFQNGDEIRLELDSAGNYVETSASNLTASTWYHVAGVYNSLAATATIYINGSLTATTTTGTIPSSIGDDAGRFHIGTEDSAAAAANFYDGIIDEARIYSRALTSSEIEELYNWTAGPVGWWKMDENTGTATLADSSGQGNNATMTGFTNEDWEPGEIGGSLRFEAGTENAAAGDPSSGVLDIGTGNVTFEVWAKINPGTGQDVTFINKGADKNDDPGFWLFSVISPGADEIRLSLDNSTGANRANLNTTAGAIDTDDGIWHHYAVVLERTSSTDTAYFYRDGVFVGSESSVNNAGSSLDTTETFQIGNNTSSSGFAMDGNLDDLRVYNYTRTPKQIVEDMNAGHPAGGSPIGSQTIYWKFDEATGTTANDTIGNENGTVDANAGWMLENSASGGCKLNGCLEFNAAGEEVLITEANDTDINFNGSEPFSGSAWVYVTTMPGSGEQDAIIAKWDGTTTARAYRLYVENDDADTTGNFEVQLMDQSAGQAITATQANDQVSVNTWYHVSFTFNGGIAGAAGDLQLYVNGNFTAQNSANASFLGLEDVAADFTVAEYDATDAVATNTAFTGRIDEVKIYSGELTPSEIKIDANAGSAAALGGVLGTHDSEGFAGNPPIAWWKLDDNTGTSAVDSSGNGSTISFEGGTANPTWRTGKVGAGLLFDGSNDNIEVADNNTLDIGTASFTLEAWIIRNSENTTDVIVQKYSNGTTGFSADPGYQLIIYDTNELSIVVSDAAGGADGFEAFTAPGAVTTGVWHHVAGVIDRTSATNSKIYLDGVDATAARGGVMVSGTVANSSALSIGSGCSSADGLGCFGTAPNPFDGFIDDVRIYNYARTPAQIAYDYSRGAPITWWKFDECQGTTANNLAPAASGGDPGLDATINARTLGNTAVGSCQGVSTDMWFDGATGKYNSALGFDGSDDDASVTNASAIDLNEGLQNGLTISAWVYANNAGEGGVGKIFTKGGAAPDTLCQVDTLSGSNLDIQCELDLTADATLNIAAAITTATWNHIVMTWTDDSDDEITIWINGINRGSSTDGVGPPTADTFNLIIGNNSGQTATFDGQIDDFRVYNYEMTAGQIQRLYNESSAVRLGPQSGSP